MPRYHIDTIPIWDALHEQGECLLCSLRRRSEHMLAERYLGGSVMEPDTRVRVNQKGFCPEHHRMSDGGDAYEGGLLIDGYVSTNNRGRPVYHGSDVELSERYPQ